MEFLTILVNIAVGLMTILVPILVSVIRNIIKDQRAFEEKVNTCQTMMPKEYVLKSDYKSDMSEIKTMLGEIYTILRERK
jgi:predicted PurR-regulated permease PerM